VNAGTIGHPDQGTLAAYRLGGLDAHETAVCDVHANVCPSCRRYLSEIAAVCEALALVPADLVLDDMTVAGRLPERPAPPPEPVRPPARPRRQRPWLPVAAVAAALVVAAFVIPNLVNGDGGQATGPLAPTSTTAMTVAGMSSAHTTATMQLRPAATACGFTVWLSDSATGDTLTVVADLADGSKLTAGHWLLPTVDTGSVYRIDGSIAAPLTTVTDIKVLDSTGSVLVTFAPPHPSP
jgi:anti-sigma factor RsiW